MTKKLLGKVALVTGCGRGIGRAIALKLASEGARVVVNDIEPVLAAEVVGEIVGMGAEAIECAGNVCSADFAARFVGAAVEEYKTLDIIVNNAGYTWDNVIQKMTDEQWYAMIDVHLTAPFRILRAVQPIIRNLVKTEGSVGKRVIRKVVNISSMVGVFGNAGQTGYSAAKAGVEGMTRTLAKEWGRLNTTVNCVAYGFIETRLTVPATDRNATASIAGREIKIGVNPELMAAIERMIPLGRLGTPEEGAGAVYMLAIPESDYVSGQTLICGGGMAGF
jgi:3-oxoacyl-[acyl-carrier protein] reductase